MIYDLLLSVCMIPPEEDCKMFLGNQGGLFVSFFD